MEITAFLAKSAYRSDVYKMWWRGFKFSIHFSFENLNSGGWNAGRKYFPALKEPTDLCEGQQLAKAYIYVLCVSVSLSVSYGS